MTSEGVIYNPGDMTAWTEHQVAKLIGRHISVQLFGPQDGVVKDVHLDQDRYLTIRFAADWGITWALGRAGVILCDFSGRELITAQPDH